MSCVLSKVNPFPIFFSKFRQSQTKIVAKCQFLIEIHPPPPIINVFSAVCCQINNFDEGGRGELKKL